MKTTNPRALLSELVVVIGLCAGIGVGVLAPLDNRLATTQRELDSASQLLIKRAEIEASAPRWQARRSTDIAARNLLNELSGPARNAAVLHETLMSLADTAGVRIERIQPRDSATLSTPTPSAPGDPARPTVAHGNTIEAEGTYAAVVNFVSMLESLGFTRVTSAHFAPNAVDDTQMVRATVQTAHFAFDVPTAQAAVTETTP